MRRALTKSAGRVSGASRILCVSHKTNLFSCCMGSSMIVQMDYVDHIDKSCSFTRANGISQCVTRRGFPPGLEGLRSFPFESSLEQEFAWAELYEKR